jgi:hypothetical protein
MSAIATGGSGDCCLGQAVDVSEYFFIFCGLATYE